MLLNKKTIPYYGWFIILALSVAWMSLQPKANLFLGNLFFGSNPTLYNVNLAQFFFKNSAHHLIGNTPPYAHYQLSRTYFIQGELDTALSEIQKEIELYPEHTRSYYILGLTYGYLNKEKEAIDAFSKFIETNPTSWAARNDKAWLQFRIGDIDGALLTILPITPDKKNPWVQNTYGVLLMNKDRPEEAREAFLNAKDAIEFTSQEEWGRAYPGNDPRIYETGLSAMKISIENNLKLLVAN